MRLSGSFAGGEETCPKSEAGSQKNCVLDGFEERIRETPTLLRGDVGDLDFDVLTGKSED